MYATVSQNFPNRDLVNFALSGEAQRIAATKSPFAGQILGGLLNAPGVRARLTEIAGQPQTQMSYAPTMYPAGQSQGQNQGSFGYGGYPAYGGYGYDTIPPQSLHPVSNVLGQVGGNTPQASWYAPRPTLGSLWAQGGYPTQPRANYYSMFGGGGDTVTSTGNDYQTGSSGGQNWGFRSASNDSGSASPFGTAPQGSLFSWSPQRSSGLAPSWIRSIAGNQAGNPSNYFGNY